MSLLSVAVLLARNQNSIAVASPSFFAILKLAGPNTGCHSTLQDHEMTGCKSVCFKHGKPKFVVLWIEAIKVKMLINSDPPIVC